MYSFTGGMPVPPLFDLARELGIGGPKGAEVLQVRVARGQDIALGWIVGCRHAPAAIALNDEIASVLIGPSALLGLIRANRYD